MKSRMTDGETRARPAVAVCCVAIFAALPPVPHAPVARSGRWRFHLCFALHTSPFSRTRRGRGTGRRRPYPPPSAKYVTLGGREPTRLLEVTGFLHHVGCTGLGLRQRLVDGHRSRESGREVLPGVSGHALEFWDRDELHARIRDRLHR